MVLLSAVSSCEVTSGFLKAASAVKVLPVLDQVECRTLPSFI
jgi:hypothetical protein